MQHAVAQARIRAILSENPLVLAPMAGVTQAPFRAICKRLGAGLTYTEMVSAKGLHYNPDSDASRELLSMDPLEVPCAVQIFGSEPEMMATQACRLVELYGPDVALIDVNMGCPVSKVVGKGEGSALMRDVPRAAAIVSAVAEACTVPVTVKFRTGWDAESINAVAFAQAMEAAGAAAVAIHGRTRQQFYKGAADWEVIAQVKQAVGVPVLGSGDVLTADAAVSMLESTGVDGVMIARGAQGNPWIFRETQALLRGERCLPPTYFERVDMARDHAHALTVFAGNRAFVRMRKHVAWYIAEMPGASHVRARVNGCRDYVELDDLLCEYRTYLETGERRELA